MAAASLAARPSIFFFSSASFCTMGVSESELSPICVSLARGGFLAAVAGAVVPLALDRKGASSESNSVADLVFCFEVLRRLLCERVSQQGLKQ